MSPDHRPLQSALRDAQSSAGEPMDGGRGHHDDDEVRRVLAGLRPADAVRLVRLAQNWVRRAPRRSAEDLLNEVFDRMLAGRRRWPVDVPLPDFVSGVMRSIVGEWWREDAAEPLAGDIGWEREADDPGAHPDRDLPDMLDRMVASLHDDDEARSLLVHMRAGTRRAEAAMAMGVDLKTYDTARRRMTRRLLASFGPEWTDDDRTR